MVVFQKFSIYIIYTCNVYVNSYRGLYYTLRIKGLKDYKESCIIYIYIYNAKFIFISTPEINQHPHSKFLLAILRWLGPSLLIDMGGHLVLNILNNTLLENANYWIQKWMENPRIQSNFSHKKSHESHWQTNGFKSHESHCLVAHYLGVKTWTNGFWPGGLIRTWLSMEYRYI